MSGTCGSQPIEGSGFTSLSAIFQIYQSDFIYLPRRYEGGFTFYSWFFHNNLVFNCTGLLGGWIFKSEVTDLSNLDNLPLLRVFYNDTREFLDVEQFLPIDGGILTVPRVEAISIDGVYEYILPSPLLVTEGYVVAINYQHQPATRKHFLPLAFELSEGRVSYSHRNKSFITWITYPKDSLETPDEWTRERYLHDTNNYCSYV